MHRLLIADTSQSLGEAVTKELCNEFDIRICTNGGQLSELLRTFSPDILLLDIMLPDIDTFSLLQAMHMSANTPKVIALSKVVNEYTLTQLQDRGVYCVLPKPCKAALAVVNIRSVTNKVRHVYTDTLCIENEVDCLLVQLGFRMGPPRYRCVFEAILSRYKNPSCAMKEIYIDVAVRCGGSFRRVEKAIRDAIEDAYENGNKEIWQTYFLPYKKREKPYPSNEDFIARMANCIRQKTRIQKLYEA